MGTRLGSGAGQTLVPAWPAMEAKDQGEATKRVKMTYWLDAEQVDALRREALRRATERQSMKPDASELVREAVGAWLAKRRRA